MELKLSDIPKEYEKIWQMAEKLSEREALEFVKMPYKKAMRTFNEDGEEKTEFRDITKTEYKDERRTRHIIEMLDLFSLSVGGRD